MRSGHSQPNLFAFQDLSPSNSLGKTRSIAALASPETIRTTLNLSRRDSFWQLLHTPDRLVASSHGYLSPNDAQKSSFEFPSSGLSSSATTRDGFKILICPPPELAQPQLKKSPQPFPTEKDYVRLQNRLGRVINGSTLSFRFTILSETKPVDLSLESNERQYIRIKAAGLSSPMKIFINRSKGKVVVYVSRSFQEPDELNCEESHSRDGFIFAEPGMHFKTAYVYLGVHCLDEATLTITVSFGYRRRTHGAILKLPSITGLEEFRKDEGKRKALGRRVEELLTSTTEPIKTTARDYIRENRAKLGKDEDENAKKELKVQRREEALRKHFQNLKDKKEKALLQLRRQELRIEAEGKARLELEARQQQEAMQKQWLGLLPFFVSVEVLYANYVTRKANVEEAGRQVKAAMVLQRCYRRVLLQINPKRLIRQHALHHLAFFTKVIGPEIAYESRRKVANVIRDSTEADRVKDFLDAYYRKSKF